MKSFTCTKCGGRYASSQSLWNHKQRCKSFIHPSDADVKIFNKPSLTSSSINYEHVAEWSSHLTIDTRFHREYLDAGSNPTCGTGGSVSENHSPGPPMPCEGNWVVSWYLTQH